MMIDRFIGALGVGMRPNSEVAQVLIAAWKLASDNDMLPISHGVLDRALEQAVESGQFGKIKNELTFVDTRVGRRCLELPDLLNWAQAAELTGTLNPYFQQAEVKVSK